MTNNNHKEHTMSEITSPDTRQVLTVKATRAQVMAAAAEVGAEVYDDSIPQGAHQIDAWAPTGCVWTNGDHGVYCNMPEWVSKAFAWGQLLEDIKQGTQPCPDGSSCEHCG